MLHKFYKKSALLLSVFFSIIAVLVAYYIGEEKDRSLQGFFLGIAIWLLSLVCNNLSKALFEISIKHIVFQEICVNCFNIISLAAILPFGVTLPFMGTFRCVNGIWLNDIGIYCWISYSLIFAGVLITAYITSLIYKKRKF